MTISVESPARRGARRKSPKPRDPGASPAEDGFSDVLLDALMAVRDGDFSVRLPRQADGLPVRIADTFNEIVAANQRMASELARVGDVVGRGGDTRARARLGRLEGAWTHMEDSLNGLIEDLTWPTTAMTHTVAAVAKGDFSRTMPLDVGGRSLAGEFLRSAGVVNAMIGQLSAFTSEVTRVAREVGTEGRLGGQAKVPGVAGTWKDLTDSVNSMAGNLTAQVRNIAEVSTAIARGDLSRKITVDVRGEILQLKETLNTMVDQLNRFASEVSRVAREVGTEGKLGGQALVPGVDGFWKTLTENVNSMASNLTGQVRNIAQVTTAVARGDLSRKITVDVKGEILELKNTINTMVDQLNGFAGEVTRVAREVGTEGKLGGQAQVPGVAGTWKDLTDNVNSMASNLTGQVRNIAEVATAIASGDLSRKITVDVRGEILELKETLNTMVDQLRSFAGEVSRVAREVGTDGRLGGQAVVPGAAGTWKDLTDNVNQLAANLTTQVRNIAEVTTAVARGDLSRKITVDVKGEVLELKVTINTMVDQLNAFAGEVTRVAHEVGTEGRLGGQARVPGVAGTWKDLTDTVNVMAANLTEQVRGIVKVVTAVADGDLKRKLTVASKGEVAALADTINNMTDTLATFAAQVTTVAREVGVEGRLGGQANVPGAAGTWKDLTGNVNLLAANLTTQVRAIAEVATAVTKGDLTRSIQVQARGEVAELKDNINTMIGNLRLTTEQNTEEDWLKTNLARMTNLLQGQRDSTAVGRILLTELATLLGAHHGVIYQVESGGETRLRLLSAFADGNEDGPPQTLRIGEGLIGQCARDARRLLISEMPSYVTPIRSGIFKVAPKNGVVLPIMFETEVKAVIELATLGRFGDLQMSFLEQLTTGIGIVLNSIEATMQTEELLKQSQSLAVELRSQQAELQQTNEEMAQKAQLLAERNTEVEAKNREIERARRALEDKAGELALTSKYKSDFLANMSHELRTPLNSILILGQQLGENPDGNLSEKEVEFARTIHGAGSDLLALISDILDLSKIESGTVSVEAEETRFADLLSTVSRPFALEAERRGLSFAVEAAAELPATIVTDAKRLHQILKNLLSNAFKFTAEGSVSLKVRPVADGWSADHRSLAGPSAVVAFTVSDTGIGIPPDKQKLIFEAFQQADAGTARKFGGTGLGLAISRELAGLLGGEIQLASDAGRGSAFTLYLPLSGAEEVTRLRNGQEQDATLGRAAPIMISESTEAVPVPDEDLKGRRILLVDDDARNIFAMSSILERRGMIVLAATTGQEAIEIVGRQTDVDLVLMDVMMPGMDGHETMRVIRGDPIHAGLPIVALTAKAMSGDRERCLESGASDYLAKPVDTNRLLSVLQRWLNPVEAVLPPMKERVNILLVDDQPSKLITYEVMLRDLDERLVTATSAREALGVLLKTDIALILIDVCMPDLDGFELAATIRAHPRFSKTAIVFVSAFQVSDVDRRRGYEAGAIDYVSVPVVPELLRAKVRVFVELFRKTRELERVNAELERRVAERTAALEASAAKLQRLNGELERRVEERTREREAALAQLFEAQKLDTIGQLTGGVAHDFNNLLMAVLGSLELLKKRLPDDGRMHRLIDTAMQGAERGSALTQRLLAFSRRQELRPEAVDVAGLIDGMQDLLTRAVGPGLTIARDVSDRLPTAEVDSNQLELALLNLAVNARDAMPAGGALTISAAPESVVADRSDSALAPGDYVRISVADTGFGMDADTLAKASDPFFTTKGSGKGTGLGLSMVQGLAAQSGGDLRIVSAPGEGTTVSIRLPVATATTIVHAEAPPPVVDELALPCTVLLVDDDPLVKAGTAAMLEDLGHTVRQASSAFEALATLESSPLPDIVLTDHAMPETSGLDLARQLGRLHPWLPVIIATGYAECCASGDDVSDFPKLHKPFRQNELAAAMTKALEARRNARAAIPIEA